MSRTTPGPVEPGVLDEVAAPDPAPDGRRPRIILNASAGHKAGIATNEATTPEDVGALFSALGRDVEVHATGSEEEAEAVTREAASAGAPAVVAAGGDGTMAVVARVLLAIADETRETDEARATGEQPADPSPVPALGILPLGSAMNVARSLEIPRDLAAAATVIADGHTRVIDVGELADGTRFFEAIAIGLHAELFAEAAAFDEGDWLAPIRAAWTALRYRPSRMVLRLDEGSVATRALVVSVSNAPYTGLGFTVAPEARLDDGRFDVRVFERFSRLELLRHFLSIALGRRRYEPRVRTYRSARVRVESASPLRVRVDGDDAGETPVEAVVQPRALRVLVPRS